MHASKLHPLLERQLRKAGVVAFDDSTDDQSSLRKFITLVNDAYISYDQDRELQKRSMELSSQELAEANSEMRALLECFPEVLNQYGHFGASNDYKEIISSYLSELHTSRQQIEEQARMLRRQTEELIQARDHTISADRLKSEFLANMSHEIRTPLHGILSSFKLLHKSELSQRQHEYLGLAEQSACSLSSLVNDILDFSKIEAGKLAVEIIPFSLREMLKECLGPVILRAREKSLDLLLHCPTSVPDRLLGDPGRLRQIILNLLGNAIKFTPHGKVDLYISIEKTTTSEDFISFVVVDSGIGVPKDKLNSIFDPFTQAEESTTRRFGGTGLGLAISAKLVELMGGTIKVTSELGQGSTFSVSLPLLVQKGAECPTLSDAVVAQLADIELVLAELPTALQSFIQTGLLHCRIPPKIEVSLNAMAPDGIHPISPELCQKRVVIIDSPTFIKYGGEHSGSIIHSLLSTPSVKILVVGYVDDNQVSIGDPHRANIRFQTLPCCDRTLTASLLSLLSIQADGFELDFLTTTSSHTPGRQKSLRILVADDIAINRIVAQRLLEEMGHTVELADNGKEVLGILSKQKFLADSTPTSFDVLLMDVQMPELDGIETTKIIRSMERERGSKSHLPIVALTAHAMKGDRERFLAAGIDEYLSKPLNIDLLHRFLEKLAPSEETFESARIVHEPLRALPKMEHIFNQLGGPLIPNEICRLRLLIERFSGDAEVVEEIVLIFLDEIDELMKNLSDGVVSANGVLIEKAAHALKGSFSNVEAEACRLVASEIEIAAKSLNLGDIPSSYVQLALELGVLKDTFKRRLLHSTDAKKAGREVTN